MVLTHARRWVALLLVLGACSPERSDEELFAPGGLGIPVVDCILTVGSRFGDVWLTETIAPDEPFSRSRAAIDGANVVIESDGFFTQYLTDGQGRYVSDDVDARVQPSTTYRLRAVLSDGRIVTASTTTPAQLDVREWVLLDDASENLIRVLSTYQEHGDSVYAQPENQLIYPQDILAARLDEQGAAGYQIGLFNLESDSPLLIDADFLDEEDLDNFTRSNSSPPLTYEPTLRIPWLAIYYAGRYTLRVVSLDRNWYDIVRTDPTLGNGGIGFGGEAGDTSTRPIFHVEGGVGVFGSVSSDSVGFTVHPPAP